jgi:hypothetical protein
MEKAEKGPGLKKLAKLVMIYVDICFYYFIYFLNWLFSLVDKGSSKYRLLSRSPYVGTQL